VLGWVLGWVTFLESEMNWTDEDEKNWRDMTKKREDNKKQVGVLALAKDLRALADAMERGEYEAGEIDIEFLRGTDIYGYEGPAPVVARRITVTIKLPNAEVTSRHHRAID